MTDETSARQAAKSLAAGLLMLTCVLIVLLLGQAPGRALTVGVALDLGFLVLVAAVGSVLLLRGGLPATVPWGWLALAAVGWFWGVPTAGAYLLTVAINEPDVTFALLIGPVLALMMTGLVAAFARFRLQCRGSTAAES